MSAVQPNAGRRDDVRTDHKERGHHRWVHEDIHRSPLTNARWAKISPKSHTNRGKKCTAKIEQLRQMLLMSKTEKERTRQLLPSSENVKKKKEKPLQRRRQLLSFTSLLKRQICIFPSKRRTSYFLTAIFDCHKPALSLVSETCRVGGTLFRLRTSESLSLSLSLFRGKPFFLHSLPLSLSLSPSLSL